MPEMTEPQVHELAGFLGRLTRLSNVTSREDAICCGVTVSQCHILLRLWEAGETTMQALSNRLGIAPSTLTRNIEPLVTRRWIRRERAENDRRRVVVRLNSEGREKAAQLKSVQIESSRRLLESMPTTERQTVLASMNMFITVLEREVNERCCPEGLSALDHANKEVAGGEPNEDE